MAFQSFSVATDKDGKKSFTVKSVLAGQEPILYQVSVPGETFEDKMTTVKSIGKDRIYGQMSLSEGQYGKYVRLETRVVEAFEWDEPKAEPKAKK